MRQSSDHSFIHGIQVATPCTEEWSRMTGDDVTRFCHSCKLNVYNISGMTTADAEKLILGSEGRMCVRFFRRKDGTILTQDCPKGLRMVRDRWFRMVAAVATVVSLGVSWFMQKTMQNAQPPACLSKINALAEEAKNNALAETKGDYAGIAGGIPPARAEMGQRIMEEPVVRGKNK